HSTDPAVPAISTLSLHDALPILAGGGLDALVRQVAAVAEHLGHRVRHRIAPRDVEIRGADRQALEVGVANADLLLLGDRRREDLDRKSTRLNSSHVAISYAVFCL